MHNSELYKVAVEALNRGWSVIPCRGKEAAVRWKQFQDKLPTSQQLHDWFSRSDIDGLAIVTGAVSRLVVLDVDLASGGGESLKDKELPLTVTATTPSGGWHYYYRYPDTGEIGSRVGILPGLDLRADGGYVVAPPSPGRAWVDFYAPDGPFKTELAEMPDWLLELCRAKKPKQWLLPINLKYDPSIAGMVLKAAPEQPVQGDQLKEFFRNETVVRRCMKALGIDADIGQSFGCILPGHAEEHPSATVYPHLRGDGIYRYADWHAPTPTQAGPNRYTLGEVRAFLAYDAIRELSKPELAVWSLRLLVEAGILLPYPVTPSPMPLWKDGSNVEKKVYDGFFQLLGVKWLYDHGQPTTYSGRFAAAWCGVGTRQAKESIAKLLGRGYLQKVGEHRRAFLYLPGTTETIAKAKERYYDYKAHRESDCHEES